MSDTLQAISPAQELHAQVMAMAPLRYENPIRLIHDLPKLMQRAKRMKNRNTVCLCNFFLGVARSAVGDVDGAKANLRLAIEEWNERCDPTILTAARSTLATLLLKEENDEEFEEQMAAALVICVTMGDWNRAARTLVVGAEALVKENREGRASFYLQEAERLIDIHGLERTEQFYVSRANIAQAQGFTDEALKDLHRILALYGDDPSANLSGTINNIAIVYASRREYANALEYFERALASCGESEPLYNRMNMVGNKSHALFHLVMYDDAIEGFEKAIAMAIEIDDPGSEINWRIGQVEALWHSGAEMEARRQMAVVSKKVRTVSEPTVLLSVAYMEASYDQGSLDRCVDLLEAMPRLGTIPQLISSLQAMLAERGRHDLAYRVASWHLDRLHHQRQLTREPVPTQSIETHLRRIEANESVWLSELVSTQREELSQLMAERMHAQTRYEDLLNDLSHMADASVRELVERHRGAPSTNSWESFDRSFVAAHPWFYMYVTRRFSDITPHELRICAFVLMKKTTAEIASMLNVTPNAVEKMRVKIRKRLDIEHGVDLVTALREIDAFAQQGR